MSDEGDGGVFRRDAKMIADLRSFREMLAYRAPGKEEMTITLEELDALLRAVDTWDALCREACEMPDERAANVTPIGREAKILGEFVTMRVDEWRRVTDELSRLRTDEAARVDAAVEDDDRVVAWDQIAAHPFFRDCYGSKASLLEAMLAKLTASTFEAPIPDEIRKRVGVEIPAGLAVVDGELVPLEDTSECPGCVEDIAGGFGLYCSACGKPRPIA